MSGAGTTLAEELGTRRLAGPQHYGTIVVVGGGCYGSYYVRQLARASRAGAVSWSRLLVVDRDPGCAVATSPATEWQIVGAPALELRVADWTQFFSEYLAAWITAPDSAPSDAIVPSPLMPHLMYEWIRARAVARWPDRAVVSLPLETPMAVPWQRGSPDGTHYVSYADWMCPINCIEPARCPHTRGVRAWTLPRAAEEYVQSRAAAGDNMQGPLLFHCTHRVYGVGMLDTRAVVAAEQLVSETALGSRARFLIGTVSHCHGALNVLSVE